MYTVVLVCLGQREMDNDSSITTMLLILLAELATCTRTEDRTIYTKSLFYLSVV